MCIRKVAITRKITVRAMHEINLTKKQKHKRIKEKCWVLKHLLKDRQTKEAAV